MKIIKLALFICAIVFAILQPVNAAVTFSVTPAAVSNTFNGSITLQISGLTNTETVVVQKYLDLNSNNIIEGTDWLVQQFILTDGQAGMVIGGVTNFNVPGDTDGSVNGQIKATLNYPSGDFKQNIIGKYLYKLSSPIGHFGPITNQFAITNFPFAQKFTGNVVSNNSSVVVPNAVVVLFPPGANDPPEWGVVANNTGAYTISAPPGTYALGAFKTNYLGYLSNGAPVLTLTSGQTVSTNITLTNASASLSGSVVDANNSNIKLPGVMVAAKSTNGMIAIAITDINGNFNLPVDKGGWLVKPDSSSLLVLGYVGLENWTNLPGGSTGVTFAASKTSALIYGSVKDSLGIPLRFLDVYGYDNNGLYASDGCYTDTNGNYVLGVVGLGTSDAWSLEANGDDQLTNYVFSQETISGNVNAGQSVLQNFTAVLATNHIAGSLKDNYGDPIAGVEIYDNAVINGLDYQSDESITDTNGNYWLNVANGTWDVGVDNYGDNNSLPGYYISPANANATIYNNNAVINFTTTLGFNSFTNSDGVYSLDINNGSITITAFSGSGNIVMIPNTIYNLPVTSIGDWAFFKCPSLAIVFIPVNVTNVGTGVFGGSANLTGIMVDINNPAYCSVGGILFNKSQTTIVEYPDGLNGETYTIPASVNNIAGGAFYYCTNLTCITIPVSVTNIGEQAFDDCFSLSRVTIPNYVVNIGAGAFAYCGLSSVIIGTNVTSIGADAFYSCYIRSIVIPASVTSIGDGALRCLGITSIIFQGNAPSISNFIGNIYETVYYYNGTTGWYQSFWPVPIVELTGPVITTLALPTGIQGVAFSGQLAALYGQPPYSWSLVSGSLPTGLNIAANGMISGMPTTEGTFAFTVAVTDALSEMATQVMTLTVLSLQVTTTALPDGMNGFGYSLQLSVNYGPPPYNWSLASGSLPSGLTLATDGLISGTPTKGGTFNFTVAVTDALSETATQELTLTVLSLQVTTTGLPNGKNGFAYSQDLSAFYGQPPYSWSLAAGSLPSGLTLASNGLISGTPTNNGTFTFTVQATDAANSTATQVLAITVFSPIKVVIQPTNNLVVVPVGSNVTFAASVTGTGPFNYQWQLNGTNLPNGIITTVAGDGSIYFSGDGDVATNAGINPMGLAVDASGNLFIADDYSRIRKVGTNGLITTVAGNGTGGFSGDGGRATNAEISPFGVAVDATGNLFFADAYNNVIRKVSINGIISTVAGNNYVNPSTGEGGYSGDGGAATNAELNWPSSVNVDASGNLFIADYSNQRVRKVDTNGIITTVAGNGTGGFFGDGGRATNAELWFPSGVVVDANGNLFIADPGNLVIRKVGNNGIIRTFAGDGTLGFFGDGGSALNAWFAGPIGVSLDAIGDLFVVDNGNNRIREVGVNGIITTVAGNGNFFISNGGFSGDGGPAINAMLNNPQNVAVDKTGNLFIADQYNNRIRKVVFQGPTLMLTNLGVGNAGTYDVLVSSPYDSVTSSPVNLIITLPPIILSTPGVTVSKTNFTFQLSGPVGSNFVLQVSSNLLNWSSVSTFTIPISGILTLTNAITDYNRRFYRVHLQ